MDDVKTIKEWRRETPRMPGTVETSIRRRLEVLATDAVPASHPATSRPGRTRLDAWGLRGRRAALRLGVAAALTVAVGGGATVVQSLGGDDAVTAEAAEFGDRAAEAVEGLPYKPPGPHQWVYRRRANAAGFNMNTWYKGVKPASTEVSDRWRRVDGDALAWFWRGKLIISAWGKNSGAVGGGPLFSLRNYHTLPTDPDALLRHLYAARYPRQIGTTDAGNVFEHLNGMLRDPLPPRLRAAIYRALPKIPGLVLRRDVRDQAGRRGDAFAFVDDYGERTNIILDSTTYRYLGERTDAARDMPVSGTGGKLVARKGTILDSTAILTMKIVDKPGQR